MLKRLIQKLEDCITDQSIIVIFGSAKLVKLEVVETEGIAIEAINSS